MPNPKTEKNRETRRCIGEALLQLMKEKSLEEIRITDIVGMAHVSRMTYYKYYDHKIEVLSDYLDELEQSALIELGDIMASYIMGALINQKITDYTLSGSLFFSGYSEKEFNMDHVIIDMQTKYGTLEVLYCRLNQ